MGRPISETPLPLLNDDSPTQQSMSCSNSRGTWYKKIVNSHAQARKHPTETTNMSYKFPHSYSETKEWVAYTQYHTIHTSGIIWALVYHFSSNIKNIAHSEHT